MMYPVEMTPCGMIYISIFMKIGIGVQAILRFVSAISMAAMLVLLMRGTYDVRR
jgi:hypothetical protein